VIHIAKPLRRHAADDYQPLSIKARLAAALHAFTQVLRRTGLAHSDVTALIDHLWSWPWREHDEFEEWIVFASPLLLPGLNAELTSDLAQECRRAGVAPVDLIQLLDSTAEIVYYGLYGAADNVRTLAYLATLETVASRYGVTLPPAALFAESPWSAHHGWGPRMLRIDVERWRAFTW
jgi:hypothetical protein